MSEYGYAARAVDCVDNLFNADKFRLNNNIFGLSGLKSSSYISPWKSCVIPHSTSACMMCSSKIPVEPAAHFMTSSAEMG